MPSLRDGHLGSGRQKRTPIRPSTDHRCLDHAGFWNASRRHGSLPEFLAAPLRLALHGHRIRNRPCALRLHPRHRRGRRRGGPGTRGRHALPAGAERLPAHRPRQVDLPQLRRRRRSSAATATCASTTRTRSRKSRSTSTRSRPTSAGWASTGATTCSSRATTSSSSTSGRSSSIRDGKAYVDDLSADEIREHRGTLTEPGRNSPWRDRPPDENLDLFERMRAGEFENGARVLRAKIDMASPNINLRDPVLYRIVHATTRVPATRGASTRHMTSPMASRTRSRASRTRSARSSSRSIGRSTTG